MEWLRKSEARPFAQGLGRLGFASMASDWERPFLGPLHAWSSLLDATDHATGADRLQSGGRLQRHRYWKALLEELEL